MVAYTRPQQGKKGESEGLREKDQMKFVDLRFERLTKSNQDISSGSILILILAIANETGTR